MPEMVNKITGEVTKIDYDDPQAIEEAKLDAVNNPMIDLKFAPGGQYNGMERMEQNYAGSGKTGYNKIGAMPKMPNSPKKDMY